MFHLVGRLTTAHPWVVCLCWLGAGILFTLVAPSWDSKAQDDDLHFLPDRCACVRGYQLLQAAFPEDVFASRAVLAVERRDRVLSPADFALVDRLVAELEALRQGEPSLQLGGITSYRDGLIGRRLISADRHCTLIQVALGTPFLALQTRATLDRAEARLRQRLDEVTDPPRLLVTGQAGVGRDLTGASADSLDVTTLGTVVLVILVLLAVYRAPLLVLVPLVTIAASVWVALRLLALFTLLPGVHLVNVSKVFAVVILYGAGTDYCLFLISRYRERLEAGDSVRGSLRRAVSGVGGALAASAGTVMCGLGMMAFAEFAKVRCAGPAIALSMAIALLASLTLTPALLQILGRAVFWPRRFSCRVRPCDGLWNQISRAVVARPGLIWMGAVLALAPLVVFGLCVKPAYRPTGELSPQTQSVEGLAAIQRHFTPGETGPITVLLAAGTDWASPAGRAAIDRVSRALEQFDNVAEVRSLTQPLGRPIPGLATASASPGHGLLRGLLGSVQQTLDQGLARANEAARAHYTARVPAADGRGHVTRLDVVLRSDPFEGRSGETLKAIQAWLTTELPRTATAATPLRAECYGVTVNALDLAQVTEADRLRVNLLVLGGVLVILLGLVRRPWLAVYLLATVLFSYYATLGATALLAAWWSGHPLGEVDWRVPFFLFTILVAIGEDYNILLITRALQETGRHGADEGMRRALARTGGTITSCGLIMAGTFATLMLAGLSTLVQIGFALAFGVLLDTFIVRPFLVPAFTLLFWRERKRVAGNVPVQDPSADQRAA